MSILYPSWLEEKWAKEEQEKIRKEKILAHYNKYREDHKVCPKCGDGVESTTGPFGPSPHQYAPRDTNKAWCQCGWKGMVDDLAPVKESEIVYNMIEENGKTKCICRQN